MLLPALRRWFTPLAAAAVLALSALPLAARVEPTSNALDEAIAAERHISPLEVVVHLVAAPSVYSSDDQHVGTAPINSVRHFMEAE